METEAYLGADDPASHARSPGARTGRAAMMFEEAGRLYVYASYGVHRCVNVVTGRPGEPGAVLIRALEPADGLDAMAERRGRARDLCNGPGRLAQALGIGMPHNGHDLAREPIRLLERPAIDDARVGVSGRVGVSRAADRPLRFFVAGHPAVKSPRR